MGVSTSKAEGAAAPAGGAALPPAAAALLNKQSAATGPAATDYLKLPQPVKYEEIPRESYGSLKPELFEGLRFDFTKPLNQNFAICHSLLMGNAEVPAPGANQIVKTPMSTYEFGATLIRNNNLLLIGRILSDGRMTSRIKYDLSPYVSARLQTQLASDAAFPGMSQVMMDVDLKGSDWNGQVKLGNNSFYGANYFQSVTPNTAVGGEIFWLGQQMKSGVGLAVRYADDQTVATMQAANTGLLSFTYHHKVNEKVALASEFMWNWVVREANACVGYDYMLRACRLRGRIDTDGKVAAYLEEKINVGVNFVLSAELDHWNKNYKFGFGMTVGE